MTAWHMLLILRFSISRSGVVIYFSRFFTSTAWKLHGGNVFSFKPVHLKRSISHVKWVQYVSSGKKLVASKMGSIIFFRYGKKLMKNRYQIYFFLAGKKGKYVDIKWVYIFSDEEKICFKICIFFFKFLARKEAALKCVPLFSPGNERN